MCALFGICTFEDWECWEKFHMTMLCKVFRFCIDDRFDFEILYIILTREAVTCKPVNDLNNSSLIYRLIKFFFF